MSTARTVATHSHDNFSVHIDDGTSTPFDSLSHDCIEQAKLEGSPAHYNEPDDSNVHQHQANSDAVHNEEDTQASPVPTLDTATGEPCSADSQDHTAEEIGEYLSALMKVPSLSDQQKLLILTSFPPSLLGEVYEHHFARHGLPRMAAPAIQSQLLDGASEDKYLPLAEHAVPPPDPTSPLPIYPGYIGYFTTSEQARRHRKRARLPPKSQAPDVARVRRYGRQYWVRRIYEAMIDVTYVSDSDSSIHRQRFVVSAAFEPADLEATAHHIFDSALAVHERGWNRPSVYYKKVVRGKLIDVSEKSVESRLSRICYCLRQKKATVDDAVRGGVTLALLCDNPEARAFTKASNNMGNKKRGEKLRKISRQKEEEQDEQEESE